MRKILIAVAAILVGLVFIRVSGLSTQPLMPPTQQEVEAQKPSEARKVTKDMAALVREQGWPVDEGYTIDKSGGDTYTMSLPGLQCHAVLRLAGDDTYKIVGLFGNDNVRSAAIDELPSSIRDALGKGNLSFAGYKALGGADKLQKTASFC